MIIQIGTENNESRILWKHKESDEWQSDEIDDLIDAYENRPKGKWIEMGTNKDGTHSIRCSKCGGGYKTRGHARSIATKAKYKFCPNCGADMRGDKE